MSEDSKYHQVQPDSLIEASTYLGLCMPGPNGVPIELIHVGRGEDGDIEFRAFGEKTEDAEKIKSALIELAIDHFIRMTDK